MTGAEAVFYAVAAVAIGGAIGTVTVPNVVHAALFLILSLMGVAGFYILLTSEFLALVQVLIYGGAVATIVLFALMLTRGREMPTVTDGAQKPLAFLTLLALLAVVIAAVTQTEWPRDAGQVTTVSLQTLGDALFRRWAVPFEIASVVLLVALIGAVVISKQEEGEA